MAISLYSKYFIKQYFGLFIIQKPLEKIEKHKEKSQLQAQAQKLMRISPITSF